MAEIKAIIFDLGGVLVGFKPSVLENGLFVPKPGGLKWNNKTVPDLYDKFAKGLVTPKQFYKGILPFMEKKVSFSEFKSFWGTKIFTWRPAVAEFAKQLKKAGYKVAIISDCDAVTFPAIMKHYGLMSFLDAVATSYEEHRRKFEPELFDVVLKRLKERPKNCIFVDDLVKYVGMGKKLGLQAVQYKDLSQLKRTLRAFGIRVPAPN